MYKGKECPRAGHIQPSKFCNLTGRERFVMTSEQERRMKVQVGPRYCHQLLLQRWSCADGWHMQSPKRLSENKNFSMSNVGAKDTISLELKKLRNTQIPSATPFSQFHQHHQSTTATQITTTLFLSCRERETISIDI